MTLTADPKRIIEVTFGGRTFRASQTTYANLLDTQERLTRKHPGAVLLVIQPCFNTGVELSAGTHDKDAVLDVRIIGLTWEHSQRFLRECGWAAWWRHTGSWSARSAWHIHMVSLGAYKAGNPVGVFIPGQVDDYYAHRDGLVTHAADASWHPADIDSTVFSYRKWRLDMPYADWPDADKKALLNDVAEAVRDSVLNADMNAMDPHGTPAFKGVKLRDLLKSMARKVGAV